MDKRKITRHAPGVQDSSEKETALASFAPQEVTCQQKIRPSWVPSVTERQRRRRSLWCNHKITLESWVELLSRPLAPLWVSHDSFVVVVSSKDTTRDLEHGFFAHSQKRRVVFPSCHFQLGTFLPLSLDCNNVSTLIIIQSKLSRMVWYRWTSN